MVNYYKDHLHLSSKATPLTDQLKKNRPNQVVGNPDCENAFLTRAPVLRIVDHTLPFLVQTDASEKAVGAVLVRSIRIKNIQSHSDNFPRCNKWSTIERKLCAIIFAIEQFRYYLYNTLHFQILSQTTLLAANHEKSEQ